MLASKYHLMLQDIRHFSKLRKLFIGLSAGLDPQIQDAVAELIRLVSPPEVGNDEDCTVNTELQISVSK